MKHRKVIRIGIVLIATAVILGFGWMTLTTYADSFNFHGASDFSRDRGSDFGIGGGGSGSGFGGFGLDFSSGKGLLGLGLPGLVIFLIIAGFSAFRGKKRRNRGNDDHHRGVMVQNILPQILNELDELGDEDAKHRSDVERKARQGRVHAYEQNGYWPDTRERPDDPDIMTSEEIEDMMDEYRERHGAKDPMERLAQRDPAFSMPALQEKISRLYVEMQHAWTEKNWEVMRPHMSSQLFNQGVNQLAEMKRDHLTNIISRIAVLGVTYRGYRQDEVNDIITFRVETRIVDYTVNDDTGEVVVGSKTEEVFMTYDWEMIRSKTAVTPVQGREVESKSCPNCGAPIDINASTKCPYCGSIIESKEYDWIINRIEGIAQETR